MANPRQFRSAGPMPVQEEVADHLRQVVKVYSKIKYLALYKEGTGLMVLAQAKDKLSHAMWREILKTGEVIPAQNMRQAIESARGKHLEEYGAYYRANTQPQKEVQAPTGQAKTSPAKLAAHDSFLQTLRMLDEQQGAASCEANKRRRLLECSFARPLA